MGFLLRPILLISQYPLTSNLSICFFSDHVYYNCVGGYNKLKECLLETIHENVDLNPALPSFHSSLSPTSQLSNDVITGRLH